MTEKPIEEWTDDELADEIAAAVAKGDQRLADPNLPPDERVRWENLFERLSQPPRLEAP